MSSPAFFKKKRTNPNVIPLILGKTNTEFVEDLKRFHHARKTPFNHTPVVLGRTVSLLRLYNAVSAKGGFNKVTQKKVWSDVVREVGLPVSCSNVNHAVQYVYMRYLEAFERSRDPTARAEIVEDEWLDAMAVTDATMRRRLGLNTSTSSNSLASNQVAMVHRGSKRPNFTLETRELLGLSCDLRENRAYRLLELSLVSGLPNEVDVVLNTVLLLSSKGSLDLMFNPNILNLLLATVGIYEIGSGSYYYLHEDWFKQTGRNFFRYWHDNVRDPEFRVYLNPDAISNESVTWEDSEEELRRQACHGHFDFSPLDLDESWFESDVVGSRVEVVGMIIRNLLVESVDSLGSPSAVNCLASCSDSVLRFAILATGHARDPVIHRLGLELLSILRPAPVMRSGYSIARHYGLLLKRYLVDANDRCEILRGLEILTRVCESALFCRDPTFAHPLLGLTPSKAALPEGFAEELLSKAINCLMLRDLHLLISGLEALLALSCLDELVCRRICEPSLSVIPVLVALLTLEAPSLGEDSLLRLRIFQPLLPPPMAFNPQALPQQRPVAAHHVPPRLVAHNYSQYYAPRQSAVPRGPPPPRTNVPVAKQVIPPRVVNSAPPQPSVQPSRRSARFATEFLTLNYKVSAHARISRLRIYSEYVRAHKAHFTGAMAQMHVPVGEEQLYTMIKNEFANLEETQMTYPNGTTGVVYIHLTHISKASARHPPNGVKRANEALPVASPLHRAPSSLNLPPSPPGSADGPLSTPARGTTSSPPNSVDRLNRAPPTPPRSPTHTPPPNPPPARVQPPSKADPNCSKLQLRQCIRNSILERSRRLKERSGAPTPTPAVVEQPTHESPKRARMDGAESTLLVAGPAEVHGAFTTPDQVTLRRVPNPKPAPPPAPVQPGPVRRAPMPPQQAAPPMKPATINNRVVHHQQVVQPFASLLLRQLPPMFNFIYPKAIPVNGAGSQQPVYPKNGLHKPPAMAAPPVVESEPGKSSVVCNGKKRNAEGKPNGDLVNGTSGNEEEDEEDEEDEEEDSGDDKQSDASGKASHRKRKSKKRKRTSSPSRYRGRSSRRRWSRKPKTRQSGRSSNGMSDSDLQRELRQMPGWESDECSTSDSSGDDGCSRPSCRPALGLLCEWEMCGVCFETPAQVFSHVFTEHFSDATEPRLNTCQWRGCMEGELGTPVFRGLYSLLAHICERHCSRSSLMASLKLRREAAVKGAPPSPPAATNSAKPVPPASAGREAGHGISVAAMTCLLRFQSDTYVRQAALEADNKGPVTRHIRLTAALVLRNLAYHCPSTVKSLLGLHQNHLAQLALSNLDSSRVISHILNAIEEDAES